MVDVLDLVSMVAELIYHCQVYNNNNNDDDDNND